jgi:hypothetical protein
MIEQVQKRYPAVRTPYETLDLLHGGYSIARFGDGEFKLATGSPKNVSQVNSPELRRELMQVLSYRQTGLLVGIPDMDRSLPKGHIWNKYRREYAELLDPNDTYANAFISRPDSDPSINTKAYFDRMESLWWDREVTLVGNGKRSLTTSFLIGTGANEVAFVECPYRDAYAEIDRIEQKVIETGHKRVLICAGAAGTCLAARLNIKNFHALDLGHIGMFWRPYAK